MANGIKVTVDTKGLDALRGLPGAIDAMFAKITGDVDADIKESFSTTAPDPAPAGEPPAVQSGRLKNSIRHYQIAPKKWAVEQDDRVAPYGKHLEYGTADMPARPFFRPAIYRSVKRLPKLMKASVEGLLK